MTDEKDFYSPEKLRRMYEETRFICPDNLQFRQIDLRFGTDKVVPLRKTIRSPSELKEIVLRLLPSAVYVSKHYQLQAKERSRLHKKRRKGGKKDTKATVSDDLILGGDFVLDFDAKHFVPKGPYDALKICFNEVCRVREFILSHPEDFPGHSLDVIFSGRGYYLWLSGFWKPDVSRENNAKNRFNMYGAALRKAAFKLQNAGFRFDVPPALNPRQVFRVRGSFNHHNMQKVCAIDSLSVRMSSSVTRRHSEGKTPDATGRLPPLDHPDKAGMSDVPQGPASPGEGSNEKEINSDLPSLPKEARPLANNIKDNCAKDCICKTGAGIIS